MKSTISEVLENSMKSTFEVPIEIPITHTFPQQTQLKNNILRDLKIELNFFKEKMKKDLTKSMETRVRYIDLASSNRYDVFNDKIKRLEEKVTLLKNQLRDLKTKEISDVEGLGWNVSCIDKYGYRSQREVREVFADKENYSRFANIDYDREEIVRNETKNASFVEVERYSDRGFEKKNFPKNQHSKSVNNLYKSPIGVNNGFSFGNFLAKNNPKKKIERKDEERKRRSKSIEKFKSDMSQLKFSPQTFPNLTKLKIESKPKKVNFFNFYQEGEQDQNQPEISPRIITPPRPTVNSSYEGSDCMGLSVIKEEEETLQSGLNSYENSTKNSKFLNNSSKVTLKTRFYCDQKTQSKKSSDKKSVKKSNKKFDDLTGFCDIQGRSPYPNYTRNMLKKLNFEPNITLDSGTPPVSKADDSMRYTGPEVIPTDIETDFTKQVLKTSSSRKMSRDHLSKKES